MALWYEYLQYFDYGLNGLLSGRDHKETLNIVHEELYLQQTES